MSDGRVALSTGTLYRALRRLLDERWIERFEEEESHGDARRIASPPQVGETCNSKSAG
jgi:DNA-binding PadR family transcriptional regulator